MNPINVLRRFVSQPDHTCRTVDCRHDAGEHELICTVCRDRQPATNQPVGRYRYADGNQRRPA